MPGSASSGQPLYLTPFIQSGKTQEGQSAAEVHLAGINVTSYAGFLTVNSEYKSNLYFWYFPAENNPEDAPVVLWLQGGPGSSSLFGLFCENGPLTPDNQGNMQLNKYSWSKTFNMIYIDNPVGTGFSFTEDQRGFAKDQLAVGNDLYTALVQFFLLFPELRKNEFFVTGESYAGKYVPAVSYAIHTRNKDNINNRINLKGLAIGDGFSDPKNMLKYGDYLFQLGIIDKRASEVFSQQESEMQKYIEQENFSAANEIMDPLILKIFSPYDSFYTNVSGLKDYYNYLTETDSSDSCDYTTYILSDEVRSRIHVGQMTYQDGAATARYLFNDIMQSVKPWIEILLENYRVLFYNGQLDIICAYPLTVNALEQLSWSGADLYKVAPRKKWMVDGELAGYSKTVGGFSEVLVRDAGHMVPSDQPKWALDLITKFVFNKPF